jgi:hypothetical protein
MHAKNMVDLFQLQTCNYNKLCLSDLPSDTN